MKNWLPLWCWGIAWGPLTIGRFGYTGMRCKACGSHRVEPHRPYSVEGL